MTQFIETMMRSIRGVVLIAFIMSSMLVFGCSGGGGGDDQENLPPRADAGPEQAVDELTFVSLSGSGTDSDGTIISYAWSQIGVPTVTITNADTAHATFTAPEVTEDTILTFRLTVTDNKGAEASDEVTITVNQGNDLPSSDAGLHQFVPGGTGVILSGSGTDSDGTIVSYAWSQVGGAAVTINSADTATATFTATDATDLLTFRLTVTDNREGNDSDDVTVSVGKVILSEDFDDVPDGDQPSGWFVVDDSENESAWRVSSGEYYQLNHVDAKQTGAPFVGSYHRGTYCYPNGGSVWESYRFSVNMTPLPDVEDPQGNDLCVMFRYKDNSNYYRLTLNSRYGFTRLEKRVNGTFSTLAVDSAGYYEGETLNVTIEVNGSLVQVYVDDDPLFSVSDSSLSEGTIALYCQDKAKFDNILVTGNSLAPSVVISSPVAYSIETTDTIDVSAIATNMPQGGSIEFVLDLDDTTSVVDSSSPYTARFSSILQGEHRLDAMIRDDSGAEVVRDINIPIGALGDYYVAVGDSITNGVGDDDSSDNTSQDGRIIAIQGYEANLNDLLTSTLNYPHIVFNEGIGGDTSEKALGRIDSILERHPGSNKMLILLGTNDAGSGVSSGEFRSNIQGLIDMVLNTVPEGMDVWVALVPPAFDENGVPNSVRNSLVEDYNDVINELTGIQVGPDLYNFFLHRPSLFADELHPNALGYEAMAYLWHNELNRDNQLALPPYLENP
jgi:lysophospholipase L1-like esterase